MHRHGFVEAQNLPATIGVSLNADPYLKIHKKLWLWKKRVMWKMSRSPVKILVRARWASVSWTGLAICCINCWEKAAKQSRSVYSSYSIKGCLWRTGSNMFSHHIFSATVKKRFVCVGFFLASHFVGECIRLHNVKTFSACWVQESNGMTHSSLSLFVQVG